MNRPQLIQTPSLDYVYYSTNTHPRRNDPSDNDNESTMMCCLSSNDGACDAEKIRLEIKQLQSTSKVSLQQSNKQISKLRQDISQSISETSYLEAAIKKARRGEKEAQERLVVMEKISSKKKHNDLIKNTFLHQWNDSSSSNEEIDSYHSEHKTDTNHELLLQRLAPSRDLVIRALEECMLQNMKHIQKLQESSDSQD